MEEKDESFTCACGSTFAHYLSLPRHLNNCIHGPLFIDAPRKKQKVPDQHEATMFEAEEIEEDFPELNEEQKEEEEEDQIHE